jgi:hypothetical protein
MKSFYNRKGNLVSEIPSILIVVIRLGPWNKFFILFNSLKDNEVAKIKNSSSAH